jgi:hypothetical protein
MTSLTDVAPSTNAAQLAANATLASILSQLQVSRVETVWTDDTGAYFIRLDAAGTITWVTPAGATSTGPGTGARPVGGSSVVSDTTRWQAVVAVSGSYAVGDYLSHVVVTDAATDLVLSNFWINTTSGTTVVSAPPSGNVTAVAPLPTGAALDASIQAVKSALGSPLQQGGAVYDESYAQHPSAYYQVVATASAQTLAALIGTAIPAWATMAFVTPEGGMVRYRCDGTAPTAAVGQPVQQWQSWPITGAAALAACDIILASGTGTVSIEFRG